MISDEEFASAAARGEDRHAAGPVAVAARYDRRLGKLVITLSSGLDIAFRPREAQGLETAKPADLTVLEISPSGQGIHVPAVDADLYLPALLEGFLGSRRWLAARLGREGGKARSVAKGAASRENGRRGGRPRKAVVA
jgi:Protein of unknown function (DUF2442)